MINIIFNSQQTHSYDIKIITKKKKNIENPKAQFLFYKHVRFKCLTNTGLNTNNSKSYCS